MIYTLNFLRSRLDNTIFFEISIRKEKKVSLVGFIK